MELSTKHKINFINFVKKNKYDFIDKILRTMASADKIYIRSRLEFNCKPSHGAIELNNGSFDELEGQLKNLSGANLISTKYKNLSKEDF